MLKYFVFNLYLVLLVVWQVCSEELQDSDVIEVDNNDLEYQDLNDTDSYFVPQPRFAQVRAKGKSYTVNYRAVNWHTAREYCTAQNQVLASVKNLEEHTGILLTLISNRFQLSNTKLWIGGSQLGHIGEWVWVSSGEGAAFTNWQRYPQPENCNNNHCMELLSSGEWNNNDCNLRRPFICEDLPSCS